MAVLVVGPVNALEEQERSKLFPWRPLCSPISCPDSSIVLLSFRLLRESDPCQNIPQILLTMSLPQPLHLAAALALVESKPKHLTIQGSSFLYLRDILADLLLAHVQSLRNSVETTHHDDQTLRRFDPVIFWRIQHDKLHDMLEIERAAMFVLQNENEVLQAQIAQLSARSKPGRKRKSAEQEEPETAKKMKAGTIAKAEFGSAGDADPGLPFLYRCELSTDSWQSLEPCDMFTVCSLCAKVVCGTPTRTSWPTI